jgi:hypothetical protein
MDDEAQITQGGCFHPALAFSGFMDDFRLYSIDLTSIDLKTDANCTLRTPTFKADTNFKYLVAYLNFDEVRSLNRLSCLVATCDSCNVTPIEQLQVGCCDTVRRELFAAFVGSSQCVLENEDSFLTCDANWGRYVTLQLKPGRISRIPLGDMTSPVWARSRPLIVRCALNSARACPRLIRVHQVSSSAPLRGSGVIRKTVQLIRGYQLNLQVPVVDYDSNITVNGNAGINIPGQVC